MTDPGPLRQAPGLGRREGVAGRRRFVDVEAVHDEDDAPVRETDVGEVPEHPGEVLPGSPVGDLHMPPAVQGRRQHEEVRRSVALMLEVAGGGPAGLRGQGRARLLRLLPRCLVKADEDLVVGKVPAVRVEHVLHRADEVGVLFRRHAPALARPGLDVVLSGVRRTVSVETVSTTSGAASRSAGSCRVRCAWPSGGCEQAGIVGVASPAPSRRRCLRLTCTLRSRAASSPSRTHCLRTRSTVAVPTLRTSAMSASRRRGGPCRRAGGCAPACAAPSSPCRCR